MQLGSIGLASTALSGYLIFWSWFLTWRLVRPLGFAFELLALLCIVLTWKRTSQESRLALRPLAAPAMLVLASAVLMLAAGFAYGGLDKPLQTAESRFSHSLPVDNEIPYILDRAMMKTHQIPSNIYGDWLTSDRPPLQSAIVLSQYFALIGPAEVAYQVLATLLQSLWIYALWLLLYSLRLSGRVIGLVLAGCLFSSFSFVQSLFVWPKLLAASYTLGFFALLFRNFADDDRRSRQLMGVTAGALIGWALLSHGGSVFALLGIAPTVFLCRRPVQLRMLSIALLAAVLLYVPWALFQKIYDPPGDRLLKMHLAGVWTIDKRSFGLTLFDSYHHLSIGQIMDYKKLNLKESFDISQFWPPLRQMLFELPKAEPGRSATRLAAAKNLNAAQFFHFLAAPGLFVLGILALIPASIRAFRSFECNAALLLLASVVFTNVIWSLVMFGPSTTVLHQGSYVTVLMCFTAGILGFWTLSKWLAVAATGLQILIFAYIHIFLLVPYKGTLQHDIAALCLLAVVAVLYLLFRVGRRDFGGSASGDSLRLRLDH